MGLLVVPELQAYLVAQGVAQLPATAPSQVKPVIYTQPRQDAPVPRRGEDGAWLETMAITLSDPNLSGPPSTPEWLQDKFVDIVVRAQNSAEGELMHRAILNLLHPRGSARAGKRNWMMNNLRVLYSAIWRTDRGLPSVEGGDTYDRIASYRFTCARSDLG